MTTDACLRGGIFTVGVQKFCNPVYWSKNCWIWPHAPNLEWWLGQHRYWSPDIPYNLRMGILFLSNLGPLEISESEKAPKCNGLLLVSFSILMGYVATQYHLPWIRECFGERRNNSTVRVSFRKNTDLITDSLGSSISEKQMSEYDKTVNSIR